MLEITGDTALALSENIIIRPLPNLEQYYVFNVENAAHFSLNRTAYCILKIIKNKVTFSDLKNEFAKTFDLSLEEANEDLSKVINFALKNNIIKEVGHEKK